MNLAAIIAERQRAHQAEVEALAATVSAAYQSGASLRATAAAHAVSVKRLRFLLAVAHTSMRPRGRPCKAKVAA